MSQIVVQTLRHSAAVSWLDSSVHIKAVADLLGHSSIAVTGDVYGHTTDDKARTAVDGLADLLGTATSERPLLSALLSRTDLKQSRRLRFSYRTPHLLILGRADSFGLTGFETCDHLTPRQTQYVRTCVLVTRFRR
jgi:hypothetical protein